MSLATSSFLRTIIKAVENHLNQRLPRYKRGVVVGQASDPMKILVAPSGENGVSDLFEYPILRPYTSATVGDPGGPALDDDLLILETTPNNPVINGQLLTNPNDKPNRDGYPGIDKVSITQNDAKKLRAHAIVVDHVPPVDGDVPATARDGMLIVSTFDNSLWKRVSGTWYQVGATKWGAVVDPDGFIDVWIAASVTLPTDGTGDQTAHTTPGYTPTVYNTSALGLDGGAGHAAYVKHDQKSITQTADGKLRAHAITITHAVPPVDADVPDTPRDGMFVVCTNDNSLWQRSSGVWERVTLPVGGSTAQVLGKVDATDYNVEWIDGENPNCVCLTLAQLIALIGSVSIAATGGGSGGGGGIPPEGGLVYSASSTFIGDGSGGSIPGFVYGPSRAFDGNDGTEWGAVTGNSGEWCQVDFGLSITVSSARVVQQISQFAATYTVSSSPNGSTWTVRATGSAPAAGAQVFSFSPVSARFWRWTATSGTTGGGHTVFTFNPS